MVSVAGAVLASCATAAVTVKPPRVNGLPAISISVPLSSVACTTNNSCVALGTSVLDVSTTSVGEYRSNTGRWSALSVPVADASTFIASSSCWTDGCLFVGSQTSGDLVWRYDESTHAVTAATAPTSALGVNAVSCYTSLTCAIIDSTSTGTRFLRTVDGGASWSSPVALGVDPQDTVTSLSCTSELDCIASFLNASNGVALYVTSDGGATWTAKFSFSTLPWVALTSLTCAGRKCLALAKLPTGWRIVRTKNFGESWKKVDSLTGSVLSLACASLERCVVGGMNGSSSAWLATLRSNAITPVQLTYVPSPIADVACGSRICAAIGVTTVMALRP